MIVARQGIGAVVVVVASVVVVVGVGVGAVRPLAGLVGKQHQNQIKPINVDLDPLPTRDTFAATTTTFFFCAKNRGRLIKVAKMSNEKKYLSGMAW